MTGAPVTESDSSRVPVAAVDCGTNSTRLLVVDAEGRSVDRQMRITRLGEGVDASGQLSGRAMQRTLSVLEDYRRSMDELGVRRARLVATSAVRDAGNGQEFLDAASRVTGIRPELLSGDEEGLVSFAGGTASLPERFPADQPVMVVDIGGGSTELVVGRPADPLGAQPLSLDIGCVRVTERFFTADPPAPEQLDEATRDIRRVLGDARRRLPRPAGDAVIGLAGTVSTLAALDQSLVAYDRTRIHHAVLTRAVVRQWLSVLASENSAVRLATPGMVEGRADVIVGGVLILDCVMEVFDSRECLVSEDDILDGLAASLQDGRP